MKIKKEYDNYEILINRLSKMLEQKGFIIIKNTRGNTNASLNSNRSSIDKLLGDMKYSELNDYVSILNNILDK